MNCPSTSPSDKLLNELLEQAAVAAEIEGDTDVVVEALESYSSLFDAWRAAQPELGGVPEKQLRELARLHSRILARSEALKGGAQRELVSLRKRGKGIMAYADQLPKRVSVRRPRQG